MLPLSYIVVDPLQSFRCFEDLQVVLDDVKRLGYDGVELNLAPTWRPFDTCASLISET